jgi:hypothetical protein
MTALEMLLIFAGQKSRRCLILKGVIKLVPTCMEIPFHAVNCIAPF